MRIVNIIIVLMIPRSLQTKDPKQKTKQKVQTLPVITIHKKVVWNISKFGGWQCKGNLMTFPRVMVYNLEYYALEKNMIRRVFKMRKYPTTNLFIIHVLECFNTHEL